MLKVYLDTQDFAQLYKRDLAPDLLEIKDYLINLKAQRLVSFPLSFLTLFEFLQDYEAKYESDRRQRAALMSQLCGNDSLPFFLDLAVLSRPVDDTTWLPHGSSSSFTVKSMLSQLRHQIKKSTRFSRDQRRELQNPTILRKFLKAALQHQISAGNYGSDWNPELPELSFEFFRDFLLDKLTENEADRIFRESVLEPARFFEIWYHRFSKTNALQQYYGSPIDGFYHLSQTFYQELHAMMTIQNGAQASLKQTVQAVRSTEHDLRTLGVEIEPIEISIPPRANWKSTFHYIIGDKLNDFSPRLQATFEEYLKSLFEQRFVPARSDIKDIFHSVYLDCVDLWRTDKKFGSFVQRTGLDPANKIVLTLKELPSRINAILVNRETSVL